MAGRIFDVDDPNDNSTPANGGRVELGTPGYSGRVEHGTPDYGGQVERKNRKSKLTLGSRHHNLLTRIDSTPGFSGEVEDSIPGYNGGVDHSTPEYGGQVGKKKGKGKLTLGSRRRTTPSPPLVLPPCKYYLILAQLPWLGCPGIAAGLNFSLMISQHICKI